MSVHRIDALVQSLITLPDRCDTRPPVALPCSEATELSQASNHGMKRRRVLRRAAVRRRGINRLPLAWCEPDFTRGRWRGTPRHGNERDPLGNEQIERQRMQPSLVGLQP
jgi:hypothetical protein